MFASRRLVLGVVAVLLCGALARASSVSRGAGAQGTLQANSADRGGENDEVQFKENVVENTPAAANGETQDREWDTAGKGGKGGTSIILSNRNQLEALQQKLRDVNEEAKKQRLQMYARAGQEDAKKRLEAEKIKQHLSNKDLANEQKLKERERGHCAAPELHNIVYSFQSRQDPSVYLAVSRDGQARTTQLNSEQDKQEACFILQPGLATQKYVSLESLAYPGYYLRHSNWKLVASHKADNSAVFNNEGTFILEKGLVGCLDGFVSFEANAKGKFIQSEGGQVWVRNAYAEGAGPAIHSSWRPVVAVADTYFIVKADQFQPQKAQVLAGSHQIRSTGQFTYMFWIKVMGIQQSWSNIFHKGATNRDRSPGVWLYPGQSKLHVRSAVSASSNDGVDPEDALPLNKWVHVAITHNKEGRLSVFFNGQQVASSQIGAPYANNGPLYVSDPWHEPANAMLADFRYYHRIATADELRKTVDDQLYNGGSSQEGSSSSSTSSSS